jgi:hypothetical protein
LLKKWLRDTDLEILVGGEPSAAWGFGLDWFAAVLDGIGDAYLKSIPIQFN